MVVGNRVFMVGNMDFAVQKPGACEELCEASFQDRKNLLRRPQLRESLVLKRDATVNFGLVPTLEDTLDGQNSASISG
jgi:hypothetical protein